MPTEPDLVRLVERSTTPVSRAVYEAVSEDQALQPLLEEGVLSLVRSRRTPFGIRCGPWVGRVVLPSGQTLVVDDKVPGSLRSLLAWTGPEDVRAVTLQSLASDLDSAQVVMLSRFLDAVEKYYAAGRRARYVPQTLIGASPRGRLDVPTTMRFRASGRQTQVASQTTVLTRSLLENDLLAAALSVAEGLVSDLPDRHLKARTRTHARGFGDCDAHSWLRRGRFHRAAGLDNALKRASEDEPLHAALLYARVLLLGLSAWDGSRAERVPHGFFVSLETLFEDAVRATAVERWGTRAVKGSALGVHLFPNLEGKYEVDPDLVIRRDERGPAEVVMDVKYKDLTGIPAHSDVYQLVAHSAALGCNKAALIYPGSGQDARLLGVTGSGVEVYVLEVRLDELGDDLAAGLYIMNESRSPRTASTPVDIAYPGIVVELEGAAAAVSRVST